MTPKEQFRAGFLLKCAEDGRSMAEIHDMVKIAVGPLAAGAAAGAGAAAAGGAGKMLGGLSGLATGYMTTPALLAAALVAGSAGLGGGVGHTLGKLNSEDVDVDELKKQEMMDAYRAQASKIRQLAALKPPKETVRSPRLLH